MNVDSRLEVELESCAVAEGEDDLAVDVEDAGGLDAEVLDLGVGVGEIGDLFPCEALNVYDEDALIGENDLVADGLEGHDHLLTRYHQARNLGTDVLKADLFQIHEVCIKRNAAGNVSHCCVLSAVSAMFLLSQTASRDRHPARLSPLQHGEKIVHAPLLRALDSALGAAVVLALAACAAGQLAVVRLDDLHSRVVPPDIEKKLAYRGVGLHIALAVERTPLQLLRLIAQRAAVCVIEKVADAFAVIDLPEAAARPGIQRVRLPVIGDLHALIGPPLPLGPRTVLARVRPSLHTAHTSPKPGAEPAGHIPGLFRCSLIQHQPVPVPDPVRIDTASFVIDPSSGSHTDNDVHSGLLSVDYAVFC